MDRAAERPQRQRTMTRILAVVIAAGAIAIAATTGDSWAVRSILVLVAGDIVVRLWNR
jgi:Na+/H+ antiporter NhaC